MGFFPFQVPDPCPTSLPLSTVVIAHLLRAEHRIDILLAHIFRNQTPDSEAEQRLSLLGAQCKLGLEGPFVATWAGAHIRLSRFRLGHRHAGVHAGATEVYCSTIASTTSSCPPFARQNKHPGSGSNMAMRPPCGKSAGPAQALAVERTDASSIEKQSKYLLCTRKKKEKRAPLSKLMQLYKGLAHLLRNVCSQWRSRKEHTGRENQPLHLSFTFEHWFLVIFPPINHPPSFPEIKAMPSRFYCIGLGLRARPQA